MAVDLAAIKEAQQKMWPTGDYQRIINYVNLTAMSEAICDAVQVLPHHRVLDVAAGTGNTALSAARRAFPEVAGLDFAPELLDVARARAAAEGLGISFETGDAEAMDYPDDSFDIVLSTCGVMFTPDHQKAASELVRVCRPGGRIGISAWTPDGAIGQFVKTIGGYAPPPPGAPSPLMWGTQEYLTELFGDAVDLQVEERPHPMLARSPEHFVETFLESYGPAIAALNRLDEGEQQGLADALVQAMSGFARPREASVEIPSNYLQVVATVR